MENTRGITIARKEMTVRTASFFLLVGARLIDDAGDYQEEEQYEVAEEHHGPPHAPPTRPATVGHIAGPFTEPPRSRVLGSSQRQAMPKQQQ